MSSKLMQTETQEAELAESGGRELQRCVVPVISESTKISVSILSVNTKFFKNNLSFRI